MGSPTRGLGRLTIGGNMQASRRRRETVSHEPPSPSGDDSRSMESSGESSNAEDEGEVAELSTLQASSGITYDLSDLDLDSESKAIVGLTGQFDVVECVAAGGGYDFQLSEHPRVHIGLDRDTCSCSTFQRQPDVACQHIFWLLDQLRSCLPQRLTDDVPISSTGRSPNLPPMKQFLDSNMESIACQLECHYHRGDNERAVTRPQKVRDIMSAFEATTLPEDFRLDLVDSVEQRRTPEQCVVQGDLEATMFRLAIHDDLVYTRLCKAMPPGATAAIYFDKILERTRKLLAEFDRYCATGQYLADGTNVELNRVIDILRQTATRIRDNIVGRTPHGAGGAGEALVSLLEDISNRNKDALNGTRLAGTSFAGEDEDQRNLYHQLVGREDESRMFPVLDALELLPGTDLSQFAGRLRAVLRKNEVFPAPRPFLVRLSALVRAAESGISAPGHKRSAGSTSEGNTRRTR